MVYPKHISDEQVLSWIEEGLLVITELESREPQLTFRNRQLKATTILSNGRRRLPTNERYRWEFRWNGKKRTIGRAKLVWMFANRSAVPFGCEVHHIDLDRYNDAASNLELQVESDHKEIHRSRF